MCFGEVSKMDITLNLVQNGHNMTCKMSMCDIMRVDYIMDMEPLTPFFVVDVRDAHGTTDLWMYAKIAEPQTSRWTYM